MHGNLLKNPNADEDLEHWEVTENGGDGWKAENMPGDCGESHSDESITKYFATSFEYSCRADCGASYTLTVSLLDENHETSHTFVDYGPGLRFISFEHGGQDTKYWQGWFGIRVTGSSVTIDI
ncbi:hypothetical protein DNTS_008626 [Danionella cerebrum]|uniref:FBA domain-containing protein n=1 Tax=Danionella cerebrum TaxID=2873325 RepID=A0A553QT26_9TELE|nr:hypothetical protein DNTS_008626 [Danionella translucida]